MNAVEVRNLSKNYPLSHSQLGRLRHVFAPEKSGRGDSLWALRDVSFSVERGEAFGIIGPNGSGKSTLLQIIAGILRPTSGSAEINGRLSALLELGSGFSPEFSGRDNVYLNGSLLGLPHDEIQGKFKDIERFADIGEFIDQPIKTYSTGMVLRLAFAVAAHVDPDILIVDEALAVGDISFRQRCMRKIHELRSRGATILFVSHETGDVKALCARCLWLQNGRVQDLGEADEVVARYLSATLQREISHREEPAESQGNPSGRNAVPANFEKAFTGHRYGDGRASVTGADLIDSSGDVIQALAPMQRVTLRVSFQVHNFIPSPMVGFLVRNAKGESIFGSNTARENYPLAPMERGDATTIEFHWTAPPLADGAYYVSLAISNGNLEEFRVCDYVEDAIEMRVLPAGGQPDNGYFQLHCAAVGIYSSERCK